MLDSNKDALNRIALDPVQSEALFKKAFHMSTNILALSDYETGLLIEVNQPFLDTLGLDRDEAIGHTFKEIGLDDQFFRSQMVMHEGELGIPKGTFITIDYKGKTLHGLFSASIYTSNGKQFWLSVVQDLTAEKSLEFKLKEANERYELAIAGSNSGIWDYNLLTKELFLSSRWWEQLGYKKGDLPSDYKTFKQLLHIQDVSPLNEAMSKLIKGETAYLDIEFRMLHASNQYHWYHARGAALRDANGYATRLSGSQRDISERKEIEQNLLTKTETLEQFFDINLDLLCIADISGRFIKLNKAWETTLNIPLEELEGHSSLDFVHPDDLQSSIMTLNQLGHQEKVLNFVNRYRCSDGSYRHIEWRSSTKDSLVFASARDITERLQVEQQLKSLIATKDKFFSIMAHDLRSPFNAILGLTDLLLDDLDTLNKDDIRAVLSSIQHEGQQTFVLLENLLEWSRSQQGYLKFNPETLSAKSVATGAIEQLKGAATIKHLLIHCTIGEEVQVYADTHMLITILRNLISNAIKFTPAGGTISILATQNSGETVFMVSDTGIGMTEKHIEQLFEIGEKVVTKGTNNEKGTGLGLVLCKDFVEKHGGRIHVKSKPGLGSTFMFTLPVKSVS